MLWLEVECSNKKPETVTQFYTKAVMKAGGIPVKLKADDCIVVHIVVYYIF